MAWFATWWAWGLLALVLGLAELLLPALFFVGFAVGASAIAGLLLLGVTASGPVLMVAFGGISLVAWVVLRKFLGVRQGQVKIIDRDINEN